MSAGGSLPRYVGQRVLLMVPMVWLLVTLVFLMLRVLPGDPISAALGDKVSQDVIDAKREAAGMNRPIFTQYLEYLGALVRFDFGTTLSDNQPVAEVILNRGGATLTLTLGAFAIALGLGIPLGLLAGRLRDTMADVVIRVFGIITYAAPVFWTGLMMVLVVAPTGWPTYGIASEETQYLVPEHTHVLLVDALLTGNPTYIWDVVQHHLLPCAALGLLLSGVFIRLVRVNVLQALKGDYVEAARARGIPERRVVRRHAFRNALVPVVTVVGLQAALTLSGAVLTEKTFNWPGVGKELVSYMIKRDYVAVQGIVTFFAVIVVVVSVLVDIVNALIDPRVRY